MILPVSSDLGLYLSFNFLIVSTSRLSLLLLIELGMFLTNSSILAPLNSP